MTDAIYRSLKDKAVVVSGGASGIGAAMVERFAGQGSRVGFLDMDETAGVELAARLGPAVRFVRCDLRDVDALKAAIAALDAAHGPANVLVNNAARDDRHAIADVTPDYWDERMAVNLRHQFFAAQAVAPGMKAAKGGAILNLGSISWRLGLGGMPAYVTAKAGVEGLTKALARDLGPDGIRVNAIVPGWVMTKRQIELWLTPEAEADLMQRQCLKEKLMPEDIAATAAFLASDEARMITGQAIVVDAGWT